MLEIISLRLPLYNLKKMDAEDIFSDLCVSYPAEMFSNLSKKTVKSVYEMVTPNNTNKCVDKREPLTTKNAIKFLLEGRLKTLVCRYCLNIAPSLSELDQIFHMAGTGTIYKVTIRDMLASFHPTQVVEDPNIPDKICNKCLNLTITSYLFTQQCERAERALRNCFDDMYTKLDKLDPLERTKKRGRQKLNPNYNVLHTEHEQVIDYAEPIINIVNTGAESYSQEPVMTELECKKCWQVLPNIDSLLNHAKSHPSTMWYHCRLCGKSFPKCSQMKKHYHIVHILGKEPNISSVKDFKCNECGNVTDNYKQHLQHIEKHKFKTVMKHVIEKKIDKLCMVCLNKSDSLVDMDKMVCIHGGYPELTGDRTLQNILASTLPDMNSQHDFVGTRICEKCLNHAVTSYIFINQFSFARERLDRCISHILKNIVDIRLIGNIIIQIPEDTIMPIQHDLDETLLLNENDYLDENKIKIDVLEDEFRLNSESESEDEENTLIKESPIKTTTPVPDMDGNLDSWMDFEGTNLVNPAKNATKTYSNKKNLNGLHNNIDNYTDVCSEFLTFNKKPRTVSSYRCFLCNKCFISEYFLKRHFLKHANREVECNLCNKKFKSKFHLREHIKMTHLLNHTDYLTCEFCGRTFTKEFKLKLHLNHHKRIVCQLCDKVFANQKYFYSHMIRHAYKLSLINHKNVQTCSFCESECSNDNQLSLHVNKVHFQIKPYACDMCDRQFYTQNNLKCHKKIHSMRSNETCEFCNKIMKCRKHLVTHIRKHIGEKPFHCQLCGQSFYTQSKAKEHMKVYHGGRYCCGVCKTIFKTKYGLKEHVNNEHRYF